jgi:hypothetical protein
VPLLPQGSPSEADLLGENGAVRDRIMVLDYIEGQGQVLGYYTNELRSRRYETRGDCLMRWTLDDFRTLLCGRR